MDTSSESDTSDLQHAIQAIEQAERVADQITDLDDTDPPGARKSLADYGRALIARAHQHMERLSFHGTGSRLDVDLRRQIAAVRGRL